MTNCNPANERIKRRYLDDLDEAAGLQPVTIDHTRRAIAEYERFTEWKDFKLFSRKDAVGFRNALLAVGGRQKVRASIRSSVHTKLLRVEKFFHWVAGQPGFKSRLSHGDIDCFSLSLRDQKIATRRCKEQSTPSLQQVLSAIDAMPATTDVERRDRAMLACLALTGSRVKALTTLRLKHVRRDRLGIDFDATEVETKGGNSFTAFFAPFGDGYREALLDYVDRLRSLGWADEDALFPKTAQAVGNGHSFLTVGLTKETWKDTEAARRVCRRAFAAASFPYYSPQAIRRMFVREGQKRCRTAEEFKAWSQNVAHQDPLTTFRNYGEVPPQRQAELINGLAEVPSHKSEAERIAQAVIAHLRQLKEGD